LFVGPAVGSLLAVKLKRHLKLNHFCSSPPQYNKRN
jgi:hypothetical protein